MYYRDVYQDVFLVYSCNAGCELHCRILPLKTGCMRSQIFLLHSTVYSVLYFLWLTVWKRVNTVWERYSVYSLYWVLGPVPHLNTLCPIHHAEISSQGTTFPYYTLLRGTEENMADKKYWTVTSFLRKKHGKHVMRGHWGENLFKDGIFKLLRSPEIDSKELIPSAYVAWRAGRTTQFLLGS